MKWLDLSCIHHLQSAAEPIQLDTQNLFTEAFSQFKLENSWFFVRYGLAEHVVGICWYHGYHLSTPREDDENRYLAINHPRTSHHSIDVKIMNPDTMEEVDGDTTGKIWISSPSVCAGYYRKQELIEQTFQATIKNSTNPTNNKTYLRTGDLGFSKTIIYSSVVDKKISSSSMESTTTHKTSSMLFKMHQLLFGLDVWLHFHRMILVRMGNSRLHLKFDPI